MEEHSKLYSKLEITIATYFGGPLAAGYLVKKNYQVMGKTKKGDLSIDGYFSQSAGFDGEGYDKKIALFMMNENKAMEANILT